MRHVVVPPLSDPTVTVAVGPGERLLDLNRRFAARAADPARLRALADTLDVPAAGNGPGGPGGMGAAERCLLARAAANALTEPADHIVRLRALGAAIRVLSANDAGLTATIDDIELRSGDTQSSSDVALAASRCTLFDPELSQVPADGEVYVVVDTDRQLPAALRLIGLLGPARTITLGGRFVAAHHAALNRSPALSTVYLDTEPRQRLVDGEWSPPGTAGIRWCVEGDERPADGRWAGWLDAVSLTELEPAELDRCAGLVLSVNGAADPGEASVQALAALSTRFPIALEIIVGAPGGDTTPRAWWNPPGSPIRLAGFRPYRPRLRDGAAGPPDRDLARWAAGPDAAVRAEVAGLIAREAAHRDLFPGRIAGALFAVPHHQHVCGDHYWDLSVRPAGTEHLAPCGCEPGNFLVNLRSGVLVRVRPALAAVLTRLRAGGRAAEPVQ